MPSTNYLQSIRTQIRKSWILPPTVTWIQHRVCRSIFVSSAIPRHFSLSSDGIVLILGERSRWPLVENWNPQVQVSCRPIEKRLARAAGDLSKFRPSHSPFYFRKIAVLSLPSAFYYVYMVLDTFSAPELVIHGFWHSAIPYWNTALGLLYVSNILAFFIETILGVSKTST